MRLVFCLLPWLAAAGALLLVASLVIGAWPLELSRLQRVSFLRATRRFRLPFAVLSSALVAWLLHPGWLGVWWAVLFVVFGSLPRPWAPRRPPCRSPWSPAGQRWLAQQRAAVCPARVYVLWSEAEWAARSAALPWARRRRFFTRGPV